MRQEFARERRTAPSKSKYHHHDDHQRRTIAISDRRYTRDGTVNADMLLPWYLSPDIGKTFYAQSASTVARVTTGHNSKYSQNT